MVIFRKETTTVTEVPPTKASFTAIDFGRVGGPARVGGVTLVGDFFGKPLPRGEIARLGKIAEAEGRRAEARVQELRRREVETRTLRSQIGRRIDTSRNLALSELKGQFAQSTKGLSRNQQLTLRKQLEQEIERIRVASKKQKGGLATLSLANLKKFPSAVRITKADLKPEDITGRETPSQRLKKASARFFSLIRLPSRTTITEVPPLKVKPRVTEGDLGTSPDKFGRDFFKASGIPSFTIAVPISVSGGRVLTKDFNFKFKDGKLVSTRQTGQANLPIETFKAADARRRKNFPGFTEGANIFRVTTRAVQEPTRRESTIEVAPTLAQLYIRTIKESIPDLKFLGRSDTVDTLRLILGIGLGTEKFARAKAKGVVFDLRDVEGQRIFNKNQANRLVDLAAEIVEGAAVGGAVGKAVTIGRGAIASVLPRALQNNKNFQRVVKALDVAVLGTLTVNEARKLKKTFEKSGSDAAIIQLIGLASFGAGFARVGIKTPVQAQKEFKEFIEFIKKSLPSSKRGQASLQKVISKNKFDALKKLDEDNAKAAAAAKAAIERQLAKAKDRREQLNILDEISKGITTPEARANFRIFVEELIKKGILKIPEIEIIPGVVAKGLPLAEVTATKIAPKPKVVTIPKPAVTIPVSGTVQRSSPKNQERVKQAIADREKTAQTSAQTLGERYAQAQKTAQQERLATAQKTAQQERFATLQRERLATLQKAPQAFKVPTGLKVPKITAPKISKLPKPFAPLKKRRVKGKIVTAPPKKLVGKGYNVFVRSRGKLKKTNINALSKRDAQALGAFVVDQSLSANFRLRQTKKKPLKPRVKFPKDYYARNQGKFREFKIVKGKPKETPDNFIELKGKRLDTLRERKEIQAARLISQLQKGARKTPKKIVLKSTRLIEVRRKK